MDHGLDRTVLISLHTGTEQGRPRETGAPPLTLLPIGALAQLGERLICIQEVIGSIPIGSTTSCLPANTASGLWTKAANAAFATTSPGWTERCSRDWVGSSGG